MTDQLTQLAQMTKIVADTGEIEAIKKYQPLDSTTNPSLLLSAAQKKEYEHLVTDAIKYGQTHGKDEKEMITSTIDKLAVNFGTEITKLVPGVVSTEVDARLSFNTQATVAKARHLIDMYKEVGISKERILIKIATTWEGIRAAEILEKEGIHCNMTLLFSLVQAVACAKAGATLISPFVGRITDWYKKNTEVKEYAPEQDPGVLSVRQIFKYYKKFGYRTIIMGASFRSVGQILALSGCDKLTISPKLLEELKSKTDPVVQHLNPDVKEDIQELQFDESSYRYIFNDNAMATEKLAEGIRVFAKDTETLEKLVAEKLKTA